jgi:hypothetical protein
VYPLKQTTALLLTEAVGEALTGGVTTTPGSVPNR